MKYIFPDSFGVDVSHANFLGVSKIHDGFTTILIASVNEEFMLEKEKNYLKEENF